MLDKDKIEVKKGGGVSSVDFTPHIFLIVVNLLKEVKYGSFV